MIEVKTGKRMQLVIDIGNTSTKLAVFKNNKLQKHWQFEGLIKEKELLSIIKSTLPVNAIIASVRNDSSAIERIIEQKIKTINLSAVNHKEKSIKLPFNNKYKTPETLGRDRLANAAAAAVLSAHHNNLVVDAGTCLKFDFIDFKGNYIGGSISPGLQMRFKSLTIFTGKLPLISPKKLFSPIGRSTEESIRAGVQQGMINEINATIEEYENTYYPLNIILTGGDSRLFVKHLKKSIFADPFLTLRGLHCILDYNT